jgi:predicted short-subunit dehydrogenase-like oxidoreductase (DUF2520 family)
MKRVRILGAGRAGGSFAAALGQVGWDVDGPLGRAADVATAARGVDLLLICVSDPAIAGVAAAVQSDPHCVVAHVAGSLGLDALGPDHPRVAALHPLVSLPDPATGAVRLLDHAWFAIDGDPLATEVVADLGGRSFAVDDAHRSEYHAAACIAANHLVALLGQVERVGAAAGAPFEAYLELARGAFDNVVALGPAAALTGPAARGDVATIERHLAALDPSEREAYLAMSQQAARLAGVR